MQKKSLLPEAMFLFFNDLLVRPPHQVQHILVKTARISRLSFLRLWSERSKFCLAKIIYLLHVPNKEKQIKLFENQDGRRRRTCAFVFNKKVCIGEKPVPNC